MFHIALISNEFHTFVYRYGWIDGQNVAFLPHSNSPNCDSSSTEVTFHSEAAEYLSNVYCFNPSGERGERVGFKVLLKTSRFETLYYFTSLDPFDINCEDAVRSASQTSTSENLIGTGMFNVLEKEQLFFFKQ